MNRNLLQLVLRHADGMTSGDDADPHLLRRFVASRDESAFALLVKRHGPLVWAVCRQSVPNQADAEDAFQATFLALAQSAKNIRTPERLAGWLHAAAVRIAAKAKRGFSRRLKREHATARPESDSPVSATVWNDLQAAVHAEVSALPPSLRAVFVLCDLEGVEHAEAARRLGLKAGTLSGQLARARQRLLAALSKRGIAAGAVVLGTAVSVPEVLANKVTGGAVPSAGVIALAAEVMTVGVNKLKLLAAGLLVAGGLTLSGLGLLAKADGQTPRGGPPGGGPVPGGAPGAGGPPPGGVPGGAGAGLPGGAPTGGGASGGFPGGGPGEGEGGGPGGMSGGMSAPAAGEFLFVGKPNTIADVAKMLKDKSAKGWEYTGPLDVDPADPPKGKEFEGISKDTRVVLVFKRKPAAGGGQPWPQPPSWGTPGSGWGGGLGGMAVPDSGYGGGPPGVGGGTPGGGGTTPAPAPKTPGAGTSAGTGSGVSPKTGWADPLSHPSPGGASGGTLNPLGGGGAPPVVVDGEVKVFKLRNVPADDVSKLLSEVFNGAGKTTGRVNVFADARTNSLFVKASAADLETIEKLVQSALDVEAKRAK